ncbi:MAG: FtsW/RodA/SpoVE family cell cycle protein, partial [Lachnospiraceae bacterium]|nr:FtsW/RodA/SpoVE family cell cycle protein [Lachnospiraceae bacterium]
NNTMATVKGGNFISEQQTDFIFSVIGEELGFVGSVILIAIIALIVIQCMLIAVKARNMSGKLIAVGIAALFSFQSFFNICVATGLMPNTGLPMPFISYGLSSLLSSTIGIGLVLNVGLQKRKY